MLVPANASNNNNNNNTPSKPGKPGIKRRPKVKPNSTANANATAIATPTAKNKNAWANENRLSEDSEKLSYCLAPCFDRLFSEFSSWLPLHLPRDPARFRLIEPSIRSFHVGAAQRDNSE